MSFHRLNSLEKEAIEIHPGQLYFWITRRGEGSRVATSTGLVLHVDNELNYEAFANDFGPLHLGCTYRFCRKLSFLLKEGARVSKPVIFITSSHHHRKANAAVLLGAWLVLFEDYTGDAAYEAIQRAEPFMPFRDASCGPSQFHLTVKHVLAGIYKARQVGFLDWHLPNSTFNLKKYEFYEQVINGDWNWIIPNKFLAFSGPTCRSRDQSVYGTLGTVDYVPLFKQEGITGIVRLNKPQYDKRDFTAAGFSHYDLYFPDGTCPPSTVLQTFLSIAETEPGAIAVHCKAGLGRTGSLIACYIMKHYGFTAAEVIAYIRLCRPGSILGPQQLYLHDQQPRMWAAGAGLQTAVRASAAPSRTSSFASASSSTFSSRSSGTMATGASGPTPPSSRASATATSAPLQHPARAAFAVPTTASAEQSCAGVTAHRLLRLGSMPSHNLAAVGSMTAPATGLGRSSSAGNADSIDQALASLGSQLSLGAAGRDTASSAVSVRATASVPMSTSAPAAGPGSSVVRTLAPNGQPRKMLAAGGAAATGEVACSAPLDSSSGLPAAGASWRSPLTQQREIRRTASNGQPRKGLSMGRPPTTGPSTIKSNSFRNR